MIWGLDDDVFVVNVLLRGSAESSDVSGGTALAADFWIL